MIDATAVEVSEDQASLETAPGCSFEQQQAEEQMVESLGRTLGLRLVKKRFALPAGGWLEIDGYCDAPRILCEAWAHLGGAKSAQKNKVIADAMKLLYAVSLAPNPARLILLFADAVAASHFRGKSWIAQALQAKGIETHVVELPSVIRENILSAQVRQYR
jgi:hypothetical protein